MAGNGLIGSLRVMLGANTAEFDKAMSRSTRTVADTTKRFDGLGRQARATSGAMKAAFAGIAVGAGAGAARQFLTLADEAKNLSTQLQLATSRSGNFGVAMQDVQRIAQGVRAGLSETAALYGNFVRASEGLGATQAQAARATETFSKALKIGGADTNAAASATLQFGQALASGVLRGDEFNSIMEASPRIAQLLADSLGVPIGALRGMAEQGKLTSDVLFRALTDTKFTAGIDAEFRKMPVTFDQAMTLVRNAAVTTFGAFDQGGQFSTAIADFVGRGADGFAGLARAAEAEGRNIRGTFTGLGDVFNPLAAGARDAFGQVRREANYARETIANVLGAFDRLKNVYVEAENFGRRIENRIKTGTGLGTPKPLLERSDTSGTFTRGARRSDAYQRREAAVRRLQSQGYDVPRNADGSVNEAGIRRVKRPPRPPVRPPAVSGGGGGSGGRSSGASRGGGGAGGGASRSGPSQQSEVRSILDGLFPDDARLADLNAKADTLGKALAARLLPLDQYTRAKDAIVDQMRDLIAKGRDAAVIQSPDLPSTATTAIPFAFDRAGSDALRTAIGTASVDRTDQIEALRRSFDMLRDTGAGAFGDIAGSVLSDLMPALLQARQGAAGLQDTLAGSAGAITGLFQAVLGRKTGGALGTLANVGLSVFTAMKSGGKPGGGFSYGSPSYGGGRAAGGPIKATEWYTVGERGVEAFFPGVAGTVVPNGGRGDRARQPTVVQLAVGAGQMFEPSVRAISGDVSVKTVGSAQRRAALRGRQRYA